MTIEKEKIELQELAASAVGDGSPLLKRDLSMVGHVPVSLAVQVGHIEMTVDELFACKKGQVLKLIETVDQPMTVLFNNKAVAKGQLVAVGDNFGIEITEIL